MKDAASYPAPYTEITSPRPYDSPLPALADLWTHRDLVYLLAWRDIKVRYKQTALGVLWAVVRPALLMLIFAIVLQHRSGASSDSLPYPVFVCAGLLPWTFFAAGVTGSASSLVSSERLLRKTYFPRLALPLASIAVAFVDLLVAFSLLGAVMLWYGIVPGPHIGLLPAAIALLVLATASTGTLLAALTVTYRDFRQALPFILQFWMLASPTIYLKEFDAESPATNALLYLNPLAASISFFRFAVAGSPVYWPPLLSAAALVLVLCVASLLWFRRMEDSFADVI